MPASAYVSRETNVIIRPGDPIDPSSIGDGNLVSVLGSRSGRHPGRLILSDDSNTLIFVPDSTFADGERVTVALLGGVRTRAGSAITPMSFSFTITATAKELEPQRLLMNDLDNITGQRMSQHSPESGKESSLLDSLPNDFPRISVSVLDEPFPGYLYEQSHFRCDRLKHRLFDDS